MRSKILKQNFLKQGVCLYAMAIVSVPISVSAQNDDSSFPGSSAPSEFDETVFRRDWLAPFQVSQNALAAGDYPVAMRSGLEALTIYSSDWLQRVDNTAILLLKNLADIYQDQGQIEQALSYLQRVLDYSIDLYGNESFAVANLRFDMARLLFNRNLTNFASHYPRAILMAQQAHQALSSLGEKADYLRYEVSLFLAAAYRYQNLSTAQIYALEAKQLGETLTGPYAHEITAASHSMARIQRLLGRDDLAEETYRQTQRLLLKETAQPLIYDQYNRDQAWANKQAGLDDVAQGFWQKVMTKDIPNLELAMSDIPIAACAFGQNNAELLIELQITEGMIKHHEMMAGNLSGFQNANGFIGKLLVVFEGGLKPFHNGVHLLYAKCAENAPVNAQQLSYLSPTKEASQPAWPQLFLSNRSDVLEILESSTDTSVNNILANYRKYRDQGDYFAAIALMNDFRFLNQGIIDGFSINEWDIAGLYALFHDVAYEIGFLDQALSALANMLAVIARATPDDEVEKTLIEKALWLVTENQSNNPLLDAAPFLNHLTQMQLPLLDEAEIRWNFYKSLLDNDNINAEAQNLARQLDNFGLEADFKTTILKTLAFNPVNQQINEGEAALFADEPLSLATLYRMRGQMNLEQNNLSNAAAWFNQSMQVVPQIMANWYNRAVTKSHVWYGRVGDGMTLTFSLQPMAFQIDQQSLDDVDLNGLLPEGVMAKYSR